MEYVKCLFYPRMYAIFAFFGENHPLLGNFQNSVPKVFVATPLDVLCSNFMKFDRR